MGSTFSIYNDTESDIWVWNGACIAAVVYPLIVPLAIVTPGLGFGAMVLACAPITHGVAIGISKIGDPGPLAIASDGTTFATVVDLVLSATPATIATTLGIALQSAADFKHATKKFVDYGNTRLKPRQTYTTPTYTLSLWRSVWLMNVNGEQVMSNCRSGAYAGAHME